MKDVIYIRVEADKQFKNKRRIHAKHAAASGEVVFSVKDERLKISKPNMDYRGKTNKFTPCGISGKWQKMTISTLDLEPGYYGIIEEETDEDFLTIDISCQIEVPEDRGYVYENNNPESKLKARIENAIILLNQNGYKVEALTNH